MSFPRQFVPVSGAVPVLRAAAIAFLAFFGHGLIAPESLIARDNQATAENTAPMTPPDPAVSHHITLPEGGLSRLMAWRPGAIPLVSPHRGGPMPGYPENALETLQNALRYGPVILEVDVRQLRDGTLILMHDRRLERTTTGAGAVAEAVWEDVAPLRLKDAGGTVTSFGVPRLETVLAWAKGRAIVNLDIKRGTETDRVIDAVRRTGTQDNAVIITYGLDQAKAVHAKAPELMMTVSMRSLEEIEAVKNSGIARDRIIAWTGTRPLERSLYDAIHREGWRVTVGTLGFNDQATDRRIAASGDDRAYVEIAAQGADIIATDRHWAAQWALHNRSIYFFSVQRPAAGRGDRSRD